MNKYGKLMERQYSPTEVKGFKGESKVYSILSKLSNCKVFSNYIILDKNGKSHQIDFIAMNESGLYVIEVKNIKATFYGDDKHQYWLMYGYSRERKQILNPVQQNKTHVELIQDIVPWGVHPKNIVVFTAGNISKVNSEFVYDIETFKNKIYSEPERYTLDKIDETFELLANNKARYINDERHIEQQKELFDKS